LGEALLARRLACRQRRIEEHALAASQTKRDVRTGQSEALQEARNVSRLGGRAAYELAPRRDVEEEVTNLDGGARRMRGRPQRGHHAAVDADLRRTLRACWMRDDAQARDRTDRRQGLAAKTKCGDGGEVIQRRDLARGVAADRDRELLGGNAATVVAHAHEAYAPALDVHLDAVGAGVQAVFDQFLDHRSGALDHLTGGDLVYQVVGKNSDGHGRGQSIAPGRAVKSPDQPLLIAGYEIVRGLLPFGEERTGGRMLAE